MNQYQYHDEIREANADALGFRIYSYPKVEDIANDSNYRELSIKKQENIRTAIKDPSFTLKHLKLAMEQRCGYCFRFVRETRIKLITDCTACPLFKYLDSTRCYHLDEYQYLMCPRYRESFAKHHESWCKRLGLWDDMKIH